MKRRDALDALAEDSETGQGRNLAQAEGNGRNLTAEVYRMVT